MFIEKGKEERATLTEIRDELAYLVDALGVLAVSATEIPDGEDGATQRDGCYYLVQIVAENLATTAKALDFYNDREVARP